MRQAKMLGKAGQKSPTLHVLGGKRRCHCAECHDVCTPSKPVQRRRENRQWRREML